MFFRFLLLFILLCTFSWKIPDVDFLPPLCKTVMDHNLTRWSIWREARSMSRSIKAERLHRSQTIEGIVNQ